MIKFNENEMKILRRAYIDYKQLERLLDIEFGETADLNAVYEYIKRLSDLKHLGYHIDFTNVDIEEGYFDFNYNDMCLTISVYNTRLIVKLADSIEIWNDKESSYLAEFDFDSLEKLILGYEK